MQELVREKKCIFNVHYENMPIQIYRKNHLQKQKIIGWKTRRGGSNEDPQSMFLSRNKKSNVYPCKPQFYYNKVGFKGGQNYTGMFSWWDSQFKQNNKW